MIQYQKLYPRNSPRQESRRGKPYGSLHGGRKVRIKLNAPVGFQGLGTPLRQPGLEGSFHNSMQVMHPKLYL